MTSVTSVAAGRIRRARRAQNSPREKPPGDQDLAEEQTGDQVARDDEEHVDADETAGNERDARVCADHNSDRDGAQSLDVPPDLFRHCLAFPGVL